MFHYLSREQEIQVESWLSQLTLPEKSACFPAPITGLSPRYSRLGIPP